jgi:hypothetical protein
MSAPGERTQSGQLIFAVAFLVFALFLASQLRVEVQWFPKTKMFAQPAFWPTLSILGMVVFGLFHVRSNFRRDDWRREWAEVSIWARSLEFVVWFMVYVHMVPVIGYLLSSLIFAPLLAYRMGYRSRFMLGAAMVTALSVVVVFKSLLSVKIPGGMIYEHLPGGLRTFMILYF